MSKHKVRAFVETPTCRATSRTVDTASPIQFMLEPVTGAVVRAFTFMERTPRGRARATTSRRNWGRSTCATQQPRGRTCAPYDLQRNQTVLLFRPLLLSTPVGKRLIYGVTMHREDGGFLLQPLHQGRHDQSFAFSQLTRWHALIDSQPPHGA
jgi:hypothetical protein